MYSTRSAPARTAASIAALLARAACGPRIEPSRLHDSPAIAAGTDVLKARVARVAAAGRLKVSEARAIGMIQAAGTGAVLALLSAQDEQRDPQLADALFQAVLGGILTSAPAPPASDPVAVTFQATLPELPTLSDAERTLLGEWLTRVVTTLQARDKS